MTYKGHVANGVIVLDEPVELLEGTPVDVEISGDEAVSHLCKSRGQRYQGLIGALDAMPGDWSEEHDKYLREAHGA